MHFMHLHQLHLAFSLPTPHPSLGGPELVTNPFHIAKQTLSLAVLFLACMCVVTCLATIGKPSAGSEVPMVRSKAQILGTN